MDDQFNLGIMGHFLFLLNKKWGVTDNYGVKVADGADEVDV